MSYTGRIEHRPLGHKKNSRKTVAVWILTGKLKKEVTQESSKSTPAPPSLQMAILCPEEE